MVRLGVFLYTDRMGHFLPKPDDKLRHYDKWIRCMCIVLLIPHLNKLRVDLVARGAYNRADRRFERKLDYGFDCDTLLNRFLASF